MPGAQSSLRRLRKLVCDAGCPRLPSVCKQDVGSRRQAPGHDDPDVVTAADGCHAPNDPQASADCHTEPDRRGHRHVSADARAARRSGRLFRRPRRDEGGDRAGPRQARARQAADRPVRQLRGRPRARRSRDLAHHRPAGRDRHPQPPARLRRADAARPDRLDADRGAARHPGRDQPGIAHRSRLSRDRDRRACRCRCSSPG